MLSIDLIGGGGGGRGGERRVLCTSYGPLHSGSCSSYESTMPCDVKKEEEGIRRDGGAQYMMMACK